MSVCQGDGGKPGCGKPGAEIDVGELNLRKAGGVVDLSEGAGRPCDEGLEGIGCAFKHELLAEKLTVGSKTAQER